MVPARRTALGVTVLRRHVTNSKLLVLWLVVSFVLIHS